MSTGKFILGLVAGASIGTLAGILLAPDKGASTRRKIVEHTNDLRTLLNDWATDFIDNLKRPDDFSVVDTMDEDDVTEMRLNTMG